MRILALDSSGKSLAMAVTEDKRVIAERLLNLSYTHSQTLMPQLLGMLEDLHLSFKDLDLLAVTNGPGSYTGIRIGLSTMKTMAWQLNRPILTISSLEAMAYPLRHARTLVVPAVDARGGRTFSAVYRGGKAVVEEGNRQAERLFDELEKAVGGAEVLPLCLLGDGAPVLLRFWESREDLKERFVLLPVDDTAAALRASSVAALAMEKWRSGAYSGDWREAEANYLSLSQAERLSGAKA